MEKDSNQIIEHTEKITYINKDPNSGIKYNWKKIIKAYKALGIPKEYDYSEILPLDNENLKWYNLNSERSVGKTTNLLLLGMVMNKMYGTQIQLIRHHIAKASYYRELFNSIILYKDGQYIKKLTDGKWNSVRYWQKRFFYCRIEDNKEVDRSEVPFCVSLSADDCYALCSTYEAPRGDWIILDECFNDRNLSDEFVRFVHLHKTIVRERISDKIFILGNTLDINNIWYRQLMIQNEIRKLKRGESKVVYTPEQMPIFIAFLDNRMPEKRKLFNDLHYGFNNPELNAIVGNGEWNVKMYPQTCNLYNREIMLRGIYFSYYDDLYLEMSIIQTESGKYMEVHPCNELSARKGDIMYVLTLPTKTNQFIFGNDKLSRLIVSFIASKRVVFSDNETGDLFEKFLTETKTAKMF